MVKNPPAVWETRVWSLDWEDPLEEGMATHSSILALRIPRATVHRKQRVGHNWATKHGEGNGTPLQYSCLENPMDGGPWKAAVHGVAEVGHDWATSLSRIGEGNGNPLQCSCLENSRDGGAWWAAVYGVTQSWTRLKRLSSSSREF